MSLATRLTTYPAYDAPHPGPASGWTREQAAANLAHLVEHRTERVAALLDLIGLEGVELDLAGDPGTAAGVLEDWAAARWPTAWRPDLAEREVWRRTTRAGDEIVYSMLMDVAITLGELMVGGNPRYSWAVDEDEVNRRDQMETYRRVVVLMPPVGAAHRMPAQIEQDVEAVVVAAYRRVVGGTRPEWRQWVVDVVAGRYEEHWLRSQ